MNRKQFDNLSETVGDNIFGQRFSFIYVNDFKTSIRKEHKDQGIMKISHIVAHISKKSYYDMTNTSTGVEKLGITVNPKQDSLYNYEKLNGLLAHLKSDPEKKYMLIRYDDDPSRKNLHIMDVLYIDKDAQIIPENVVESMMTPSALKSKRNEYGRSAALNLTTGFRSFKWHDIASIRLAGLVFVDSGLTKYATLVKPVKLT